MEAFEARGDEAVYVIGNDGYRQKADTPGGWRNCNLRTQFNRIIKRAGLEPWPRLFHALRASRETELAREFPLHVVTSWLGNTPRIAMKHYLMTTEDDFARAIGGPVEKADKAVQKSTHATAIWGEIRSAAACRSESQEVARNEISPCDTRAYANPCKVVRRPAKNISGEDRIRTCGGLTPSRI